MDDNSSAPDEPPKTPVETVEKKLQTVVRCTPHVFVTDENPSMVLRNVACQTAIYVNPEAKDEDMYLQLEYMPYSELAENALKELDLPRKAFLNWGAAVYAPYYKESGKFNEDEVTVTPISSTSSPTWRANSDEMHDVNGSNEYKKATRASDASLISFHGYSFGETKVGKLEKVNEQVQTYIGVSPMVFDKEDDVAVVTTEDGVQSDVTLTPDDSNTKILNVLQEENQKPALTVINEDKFESDEDLTQGSEHTNRSQSFDVSLHDWPEEKKETPIKSSTDDIDNVTNLDEMQRSSIENSDDLKKRLDSVDENKAPKPLVGILKIPRKDDETSEESKSIPDTPLISAVVPGSKSNCECKPEGDVPENTKEKDTVDSEKSRDSSAFFKTNEVEVKTEVDSEVTSEVTTDVKKDSVDELYIVSENYAIKSKTRNQIIKYTEEVSTDVLIVPRKSIETPSINPAETEGAISIKNDEEELTEETEKLSELNDNVNNREFPNNSETAEKNNLQLEISDGAVTETKEEENIKNAEEMPAYEGDANAEKKNEMKTMNDTNEVNVNVSACICSINDNSKNISDTAQDAEVKVNDTIRNDANKKEHSREIEETAHSETDFATLESDGNEIEIDDEKNYNIDAMSGNAEDSLLNVTDAAAEIETDTAENLEKTPVDADNTETTDTKTETITKIKNIVDTIEDTNNTSEYVSICECSNVKKAAESTTATILNNNETVNSVETKTEESNEDKVDDKLETVEDPEIIVVGAEEIISIKDTEEVSETEDTEFNVETEKNVESMKPTNKVRGNVTFCECSDVPQRNEEKTAKSLENGGTETDAENNYNNDISEGAEDSSLNISDAQETKKMFEEDIESTSDTNANEADIDVEEKDETAKTINEVEINNNICECSNVQKTSEESDVKKNTEETENIPITDVKTGTNDNAENETEEINENTNNVAETAEYAGSKVEAENEVVTIRDINEVNSNVTICECSNVTQATEEKTVRSLESAGTKTDDEKDYSIDALAGHDSGLNALDVAAIKHSEENDKKTADAGDTETDVKTLQEFNEVNVNSSICECSNATNPDKDTAVTILKTDLIDEEDIERETNDNIIPANSELKVADTEEINLKMNSGEAANAGNTETNVETEEKLEILKDIKMGGNVTNCECSTDQDATADKTVNNPDSNTINTVETETEETDSYSHNTTETTKDPELNEIDAPEMIENKIVDAGDAETDVEVENKLEAKKDTNEVSICECSNVPQGAEDKTVKKLASDETGQETNDNVDNKTNEQTEILDDFDSDVETDKEEFLSATFDGTANDTEATDTFASANAEDCVSCGKDLDMELEMDNEEIAKARDFFGGFKTPPEEAYQSESESTEVVPATKGEIENQTTDTQTDFCVIQITQVFIKTECVCSRKTNKLVDVQTSITPLEQDSSDAKEQRIEEKNCLCENAQEEIYEKELGTQVTNENTLTESGLEGYAWENLDEKLTEETKIDDKLIDLTRDDNKAGCQCTVEHVFDKPEMEICEKCNEQKDKSDVEDNKNVDMKCANKTDCTEKEVIIFEGDSEKNTLATENDENKDNVNNMNEVEEIPRAKTMSKEINDFDSTIAKSDQECGCNADTDCQCITIKEKIIDTQNELEFADNDNNLTDSALPGEEDAVLSNTKSEVLQGEKNKAISEEYVENINADSKIENWNSLDLNENDKYSPGMFVKETCGCNVENNCQCKRKTEGDDVFSSTKTEDLNKEGEEKSTDTHNELEIAINDNLTDSALQSGEDAILSNTEPEILQDKKNKAISEEYLENINDDSKIENLNSLDLNEKDKYSPGMFVKEACECNVENNCQCKRKTEGDDVFPSTETEDLNKEGEEKITDTQNELEIAANDNLTDIALQSGEDAILSNTEPEILQDKKIKAISEEYLENINDDSKIENWNSLDLNEKDKYSPGMFVKEACECNVENNCQCKRKTEGDDVFPSTETEDLNKEGEEKITDTQNELEIAANDNLTDGALQSEEDAILPNTEPEILQDKKNKAISEEYLENINDDSKIENLNSLDLNEKDKYSPGMFVKEACGCNVENNCQCKRKTEGDDVFPSTETEDLNKEGEEKITDTQNELEIAANDNLTDIALQSGEDAILSNTEPKILQDKKNKAISEEYLENINDDSKIENWNSLDLNEKDKYSPGMFVKETCGCNVENSCQCKRKTEGDDVFPSTKSEDLNKEGEEKIIDTQNEVEIADNDNNLTDSALPAEEDAVLPNTESEILQDEKNKAISEKYFENTNNESKIEENGVFPSTESEDLNKEGEEKITDTQNELEIADNENFTDNALKGEENAVLPNTESEVLQDEDNKAISEEYAANINNESKIGEDDVFLSTETEGLNKEGEEKITDTQNELEIATNDNLTDGALQREEDAILPNTEPEILQGEKNKAISKEYLENINDDSKIENWNSLDLNEKDKYSPGMFVKETCGCNVENNCQCKRKTEGGDVFSSTETEDLNKEGGEKIIDTQNELEIADNANFTDNALKGEENAVVPNNETEALQDEKNKAISEEYFENTNNESKIEENDVFPSTESEGLNKEGEEKISDIQNELEIADNANFTDNALKGEENAVVPNNETEALQDEENKAISEEYVENTNNESKIEENGVFPSTETEGLNKEGEEKITDTQNELEIATNDNLNDGALQSEEDAILPNTEPEVLQDEKNKAISKEYFENTNNESKIGEDDVFLSTETENLNKEGEENITDTQNELEIAANDNLITNEIADNENFTDNALKGEENAVLPNTEPEVLQDEKNKAISKEYFENTNNESKIEEDNVFPSTESEDLNKENREKITDTQNELEIAANDNLTDRENVLMDDRTLDTSKLIKYECIHNVKKGDNCVVESENEKHSLIDSSTEFSVAERTAVIEQQVCSSSKPSIDKGVDLVNVEISQQSSTAQTEQIFVSKKNCSCARKKKQIYLKSESNNDERPALNEIKTAKHHSCAAAKRKLMLQPSNELKTEKSSSRDTKINVTKNMSIKETISASCKRGRSCGAKPTSETNINNHNNNMTCKHTTILTEESPVRKSGTKCGERTAQESSYENDTPNNGIQAISPKSSNVMETKISTLQNIYGMDQIQGKEIEKSISFHCAVEKAALNTVRILQDTLDNIKDVYKSDSETCCSPNTLQKKLSEIRNAIGGFKKRVDEQEIECECLFPSPPTPSHTLEIITPSENCPKENRACSCNAETVREYTKQLDADYKELDVQTSFLTICACPCHESQKQDAEVRDENMVSVTHNENECSCTNKINKAVEREAEVCPKFSKDTQTNFSMLEAKEQKLGSEIAHANDEQLLVASSKITQTDSTLVSAKNKCTNEIGETKTNVNRKESCVCKKRSGSRAVDRFRSSVDRGASPIIIKAGNVDEKLLKNADFVTVGDGTATNIDANSEITVEFLLKKESANKVESVSGALLVKKIISNPDTSKKMSCPNDRYCAPDASVSLPDIRDAVVIRLPVVCPHRKKIDFVDTVPVEDRGSESIEIICECASLLITNMEMGGASDDFTGRLLSELLQRAISGDITAAECIKSIVTDIAGVDEERCNEPALAKGDSAFGNLEEELYIRKLLEDVLDELHRHTNNTPSAPEEFEGEEYICVCELDESALISGRNISTNRNRNVQAINKTLIVTKVNKDGSLEITMNSVNETPNCIGDDDGNVANSPLRPHSFTFLQEACCDQEPYMDNFFWDTNVTVQTDLTVSGHDDNLESNTDGDGEVATDCASCRDGLASVDWEKIIVPPTNTIEFKLVKKAERERPRRNPHYDKIEELITGKNIDPSRAVPTGAVIETVNTAGIDPNHPCYPNDNYKVASSSSEEDTDEDFIPIAAVNEENSKKKKKKGKKCKSCVKGEDDQDPPPTFSKKPKVKKKKCRPCRGPEKSVYDPESDLCVMIEPYTENLKALFPQDPCTDTVEIPWNELVYRKSVRLYREPRTSRNRIERIIPKPCCDKLFCICNNDLPIDVTKQLDTTVSSCGPPKRSGKQFTFEVLIPKECGEKTNDDIGFQFKGPDSTTSKQIKFGENVAASCDQPYVIESKKIVTCTQSSYIINIKPSTECPYPSEELTVDEPRCTPSNADGAVCNDECVTEDSELITIVNPPITTKSEGSTECNGTKKKKNVNIDNPENMAPCGTRSAPEIMQGQDSIETNFKATVSVKRTGQEDQVFTPAVVVDDKGTMRLKIPVTNNEDGTLPTILVKINASKTNNDIPKTDKPANNSGKTCFDTCADGNRKASGAKVTVKVSSNQNVSCPAKCVKTSKDGSKDNSKKISISGSFKTVKKCINSQNNEDPAATANNVSGSKNTCPGRSGVVAKNNEDPAATANNVSRSKNNCPGISGVVAKNNEDPAATANNVSRSKNNCPGRSGVVAKNNEDPAATANNVSRSKNTSPGRSGDVAKSATADGEDSEIPSTSAPCSCGTEPSGKTMNSSNQILQALQTYEREMRPLKEALNTLHTKLHSLDLSELKMGYADNNISPSFLPTSYMPPVPPIPFENIYYPSDGPEQGPIISSPVFDRRNSPDKSRRASTSLQCRCAVRNEVILPPRDIRKMPAQSDSSCPFISAMHGLSRTFVNNEPSNCPFIEAVREIGSRGNLERTPKYDNKNYSRPKERRYEDDDFYEIEDSAPSQRKSVPMDEINLKYSSKNKKSKERLARLSITPKIELYTERTEENSNDVEETPMSQQYPTRARLSSEYPSMRPYPGSDEQTQTLRSTQQQSNCGGPTCHEYIRYPNTEYDELDQNVSSPHQYTTRGEGKSYGESSRNPRRDSAVERNRHFSSAQQYSAPEGRSYPDSSRSPYRHSVEHNRNVSPNQQYCTNEGQSYQEYSSAATKCPYFGRNREPGGYESRRKLTDKDSCFLSWCPFVPQGVEEDFNNPYATPRAPPMAFESREDFRITPEPEAFDKPFSDIVATIRRRKSVSENQCPALFKYNELDFMSNVSTCTGVRNTPKSYGSPCYALNSRNVNENNNPALPSLPKQQMQCFPGCRGRVMTRKESDGFKQISLVRCPAETVRTRQSSRVSGSSGLNTTITARFPRTS